MKKYLALAVSGIFAAGNASAISIIVDYTYDTQSFFNTPAKKDAMQAAADRYSTIIDSSLAAVGPGGTGTGTSAGWRIGFSHPGEDSTVRVSTAISSTNDPLVDAGAAEADVYGFGGLNADQWVLYAGGRSLGGPAGVGGTGGATNFPGAFDDINGPYHRGFDDNMANGGPSNEDLPRWGGSISFESSLNWHFGIGTSAGSGEIDFYTIALHEVGHALGLSTSWNQWQDDGAGNYNGAAAIAAYNADNGATVTSLDLVASDNGHWAEDTYDAEIFAAGDPNLAGTVGLGSPQDLLMEPEADLIFPTQMRIELTNVDVAALQDVGWSVIPESGTTALLGLTLLLLGRRRR